MAAIRDGIRTREVFLFLKCRLHHVCLQVCSLNRNKKSGLT